MLTATIGPMQFAFRGAIYRRVVTEPGTPLGMFEGVEVVALREGASCFLVIDHRQYPERPARVEVWMPTTPHEGVEALLVLADATQVTEAQWSTLSDAVGAVACTPDSGNKTAVTTAA